MADLPTSYDDIVQLNKDYVFFPWVKQATIDPIPMVRAEGVTFWDADGKRYLDFASQLMNVNVGHGHRRIIEAIKAKIHGKEEEKK